MGVERDWTERRRVGWTWGPRGGDMTESGRPTEGGAGVLMAGRHQCGQSPGFWTGGTAPSAGGAVCRALIPKAGHNFYRHERTQ
jgi:hypothetical protein